jgi:hypothetical protein
MFGFVDKGMEKRHRNQHGAPAALLLFPEVFTCMFAMAGLLTYTFFVSLPISLWQIVTLVTKMKNENSKFKARNSKIRG